MPVKVCRALFVGWLVKIMLTFANGSSGNVLELVGRIVGGSESNVMLKRSKL